jgi:hypothetical protein
LKGFSIVLAAFAIALNHADLALLAIVNIIQLSEREQDEAAWTLEFLPFIALLAQ